MLKELIKRAGRRIVGDNVMLKNVIRRYSGEGRYFTAAALTLYMMPLLKVADFREKVRRYDFEASADYYGELQDLLHIAGVEGSEFVRIGRENDGGYILLNDFAPGGIAYSFGISQDVSWDKDMASRGYDVFMYDHTIDGLPEENARFHWSKLGIADGVSHDERLKTLEELLAMNHHENERDMILKMDVEGAEWGFLESVKPEILTQFSQIAFEFHGMNSPQLSGRILSVLRKINTTHQLVHLHRMNIGYYVCRGGKIFCNQIEVLYAKRGKYKFIQDYEAALPLNVDSPTNNDIPDLEPCLWNVKANVNDSSASVMAVMRF